MVISILVTEITLHENTSNNDANPVGISVPFAFAETDCSVLTNSGRKVVELNLVAQSTDFPIIGDRTYSGLSFNGQIPGPTIRVTQGDVLQITFTVPSTESIAFGIDMHSMQSSLESIGRVNPGQSQTFCHIAEHPGIFAYHGSGIDRVAMDQHVFSGMYGIVIVDPLGGYQKLVLQKTQLQNGKTVEGIQVCSADALEFQLQYNQLYLTPEGSYDPVAMFQHHNTATVVNGMQFGYTPSESHNALVTSSDQNIFPIRPWDSPNLDSQYRGHQIYVPIDVPTRWFVENHGNELLDFHIEGELIDKITQGTIEVVRGVDTWTIGGSQGAILDIVFEEPGIYLAVNHDYSAIYTGALSVINAYDPYKTGGNFANPSDAIPPVGTNSIFHPGIDIHGLYTTSRAKELENDLIFYGSNNDFPECGKFLQFVLPPPPEDPTINVEPTAKFHFTNQDDPQSYVFTSDSFDIDGNITQFFWDFGDGSISQLQNPKHQFASGDYLVTLVVVDDQNATSVATSEISVKSNKLEPNAQFNFSADNENLLTYLFDSSQSDDMDGTIEKYFWEFGDGTTSTIANPIHTYSKSGTYSVTLTVYDNDDLSDESTKEIIISQIPKPVLEIKPITDLSIDEGKRLEFIVEVTDRSLKDVRFNLASDAPLGASIEPNSGSFVWIPSKTQNGTYTFDIIAKTNTLEDKESVTITVLDIAEPEPKPKPEPEPEPICGPGTELVNGVCKVVKEPEPPIDPVLISLGGITAAGASGYALYRRFKIKRGSNQDVKIGVDVEVSLE